MEVFEGVAGLGNSGGVDKAGGQSGGEGRGEAPRVCPGSQEPVGGPVGGHAHGQVVLGQCIVVGRVRVSPPRQCPGGRRRRPGGTRGARERGPEGGDAPHRVNARMHGLGVRVEGVPGDRPEALLCGPLGHMGGGSPIVIQVGVCCG